MPDTVVSPSEHKTERICNYPNKTTVKAGWMGIRYHRFQRIAVNPCWSQPASQKREKRISGPPDVAEQGKDPRWQNPKSTRGCPLPGTQYKKGTCNNGNGHDPSCVLGTRN